MASSDLQGTLSVRAREFVSCENLNAHGASRTKENPYHPFHNPEGIISVGAAENDLCPDLISTKLNSTGLPKFSEELQGYFDFSGIQSFREGIAAFLTKQFKSKTELNPSNIVVLNGADVVLEQFAFCVAEAGEGVLVPAPFYSVITNNFWSRARVHPVPIYNNEENSSEAFLPTTESLESTYQEAEAKGIKIKGILLVNPNNPTGIAYPKSTLEVCLKFAERYRLHVCVDEVYGLTVFGEGTSFVSVLSLDLPDPERTHVIWSFSKDFTMPGFRCGVFYSRNRDILSAFKKLSSFHMVPTIAQQTLEIIVKDIEWFSGVYLPENLRRLKRGRDLMSRGLQDLGIPHVQGGAGFFIWANFRQVLELAGEVTVEREFQWWYFLLRCGLFTNCGQAFLSKEPGWFRIIFSHPEGIIELALERLKTAMKRIRENPNCLDEIDVVAEKKKESSVGFCY